MDHQPTVLDLINSRAKDESRPGHRMDSYKIGLVIEGGGMRGVVGGGMISALEMLELTPVFDAVYGSSSGAITGAYLVSGQARFGTTIYYDNINNSNFINLLNLFNSNPVLSLEFLLDHVCINEKRLDTDKVLNGPLPLIVVATSFKDMAAHGLGAFRDKGELFEALRCSARIPWVAGEPIFFRRDTYVDGGVTESIPYKIARKDGCTHVMALLTRPLGMLRSPAGLVDKTVIARWLDARRSGLGKLYLRRSEAYLDEIDFLRSQKRQQAEGLAVLAVQIEPTAPMIATLEKRRHVLVSGAMAGFQAVYRALDLKVPNVVELLHCEPA